MHNEQTISSLINKSFDFNKFNTIINIDPIQVKIEAVGFTDELLTEIQETTYRIISSLKNLKDVLEHVDKTGRNVEFEINWVFEGRKELSIIFGSIDLLEYNVNILLTKVENLPNEKTVQLLDNFTTICNISLEVKKIIFPFKKRLNIANHHNEIKKEVLTSVGSEIEYCIQKLEELNEKKKVLNLEKEVEGMTIEDFKRKSDEMKTIGTSNKYNGLIVFSALDEQIFESYTTLYESVFPISQSLKIIPKALDDFYQNSKLFYKDVVLENIEKYENITSEFNKYRQDLKIFKRDYIVNRTNLISENIFNDLSIQDEKMCEYAINILRPIDNYYGLTQKYSTKLKELEDKFFQTKQVENIQTPVPKARHNKPRRVYSNPLSDSLNMKPILSDHESTRRADIKIFQTPRHIDDDVFSKDNIEIIDKIKFDVDKSLKQTSEFTAPKSLDTPSIEYSPLSTDSSPEGMQTRNIFDSPDPFITPNSRSFHKSKIPISTPLTTPRITPTKNYVMLPIDEIPKPKKFELPGSTTQTPLLRFELSTIVDVNSTNKTKTLASEGHSKSNISDASLTMTPSQIPTIQKSSNKTSPSTSISRIPLPRRPESRLDMLRSVSRLQVDRVHTERKSTPRELLNRSDSRLENIASSISTKLGTSSPVLSSDLKMRPATVMSHRDVKPRERPFQSNRWKQNNEFTSELCNIKVRGVTSLGSRRTEFNSRISSI